MITPARTSRRISLRLGLWTCSCLVACIAAEGFEAQRFPMPGNTWTVAVGDLDGDGDSDVLAAGDRHGTILINGAVSPAGTASAWTTRLAFRPPGGGFLGCMHGQLADLDGDGDVDFAGAIYEKGGKGPVIAVNPGASGDDHWALRPLEPLDHGHGLLMADLDADGHADIISNATLPDYTGVAYLLVPWADLRSSRTGAIPWEEPLPDGRRYGWRWSYRCAAGWR